MLGQPWVRVLYGGKDITGDISGGLLSVDWTDNLTGKSDELSVKLQDKDGLWRGPWRPEKGDEVQAFMGRSGDGEIDCGLFTVDIPDAGGNRSGGDWLSFKAVSAPHTQALRTQRSDFDEDTDLKKIITKRAGRNGLSVAGTIDPVAFKYKRQRRELDLAFIRRMAEDYNHFVSIKSRQLVFFPRQQLESANAVVTFELADLAIATNWSAREQEHGTYSKAKSRYLDPDKKETIKAEINDDRVREVAFILQDEIMLALWSDPATPLAYKTQGVPLVVAYNLALQGIPPDSITVVATGPQVNITLIEPIALLSAEIVRAHRLGISAERQRATPIIQNMRK